MVYNILATYAIAYILSESNLLNTPREWLASKNKYLAELIYCPICLSYWIALIITGNLLESFAIMGTIAIISKIYDKSKPN